MERERIIERILSIVSDDHIGFHIENGFHECTDGTKANMRHGMKWVRDTIIRAIDHLYSNSKPEREVNYAVEFEASWILHRNNLLRDILKLFIKNNWQIPVAWVDEFIRITKQNEKSE